MKEHGKDKRGDVFLRGIGSWEHSSGQENRVEETVFCFRNKNIVDENGEDTAVEGRESDTNFCRLTTNVAGYLIVLSRIDSS